MNKTTRWSVLWTEKPKNKRPKWYDGELHVRKCGKRAILLDEKDEIVTNVHFRPKDKLKDGETILANGYGIQVDAQLTGAAYWNSVKRTTPLFSQLYEGDAPQPVVQETTQTPAHTILDDLQPHSSTQFVAPQTVKTEMLTQAALAQPHFMTQTSGSKTSCKLIKPKEVRRFQPYGTDSCKQSAVSSQLSQLSHLTELNEVDLDLSNIGADIKTELNAEDAASVVNASLDTRGLLDEPIPDISSQLSNTSISGPGLTNPSQGNSQYLDNWLDGDDDPLDKAESLNETASLPLFE